MYLTAQTMFRSLPASLPKQQLFAEGVVYTMLLLRRRLFYVGLLTGHIPSALCLWWSFSYTTPAGQTEKNMILRCLDDDKMSSLDSKLVTLVGAVKADAQGDVSAARGQFNLIDLKDLSEFDLLWKKSVEYLFAGQEEKAFAMIRFGSVHFSMPVIVHTLEQLMDYTRNEDLKIRIAASLNSYLPSKYTLRSIAMRYENNGEQLLAREYHEIAAASGDRESQEWMVKCLESLPDNRKSKYDDKNLEFWKALLKDTGGAGNK